MGFSVSATMAIFFAAFLILFSILYSSMNDAFDSVSESFDERYEHMNDKLQTSVSMLDVSYQRDSDLLEVRVQNTGSQVLDISKVDLLLGGVLMTSANRTIEGKSTDVWLPLETLSISVEDPDIVFDADIDPRTAVINNAALSSPSNITVGDEVYVLDGQAIDVFTLEGVFHFTISDAANLVSPSDLKAWGEYLYVLDEGTHIDRFDSNGTWIDRIVNDSANSPSPSAFAVDSEHIYVVDSGNHVDRYNRSTGSFVDELISNGGTMTAPQDISVGSSIFVLDYSSGHHVDAYNLDGTGGSQIIGPTLLSSPTDICTSAACLEERFLYVTNGSREILVFNSTGAYIGVVDASLSDSVAGIDVTGRVYVSDGVNGLVIQRLGTNIKVVVENGVSCVTVL